MGASHETTEMHLRRLKDVNYYIKVCQDPFEEWLYQDPTCGSPALVLTSTEEKLDLGPACLTKSYRAGQTTGIASIPASVSKMAHPEEKRAAKQEGAELIHKICIKTARIIVVSPWIPTKAVWLVPGRPGYMVYKEDSTGRPETWKDPYCILCASYGSQDHIDSDEHIGMVVAANNYVILTGWGQIVAWLE